MAPLVDISGLRYSYPEGPGAALDGVSLALDGGLCLVAGASGGGKSTLLRLLNGLVPHLHGGRVSGRAEVAGQDVLRTPTRRLAGSVGFVFQDAERQSVHATVERDIAFGLENRRVGAGVMAERVGAVMERLGITNLRGRAIAGLSGGERQRVALAGVLVLSPRLLALDEPFAQLDAPASRALLELCLELREGGTALVVAEHRLDALLPVADSVVAVAEGHLSGPGTAASMAAALESAPQVVRLSGVMGWSPPLLDPAPLRPQVHGRLCQPLQGPASAVAGPEAWRLDGIVAGPADLLEDVSAVGHAGEVVVVMGRNGAGKTTLLRVIAGLALPRAGVAWREGPVAYLPQNPSALLHRESVDAEVAWTVRAQRRGGGRVSPGLAAELLHTLGLDAIGSRDPRDLSSGQRQRAAVAAILCGTPAIALLDEPTRGMDGPARDALAAAVRLLARQGTCLVIATHDSDLAAAVANRVLVLADGSLREAGTTERALSGPLNEHATQLGRLFEAPGPVTVEAVAACLSPAAGAVSVAP